VRGVYQSGIRGAGIRVFAVCVFLLFVIAINTAVWLYGGDD